MKRIGFVGADFLAKGKGRGHPLLLRDGSVMSAGIEWELLRGSASLDRSTAVPPQNVIAVDQRHPEDSPPYHPFPAHDLENVLKKAQGLGAGNEEFRDEIV